MQQLTLMIIVAEHVLLTCDVFDHLSVVVVLFNVLYFGVYIRTLINANAFIE
mgnify:CR=1 FL=1